MTKRDLGSRVRARTTITRAGYTTLTPTTDATRRVRTVPRIRLDVTAHAHRVHITATVTARGISPMTGTLHFTLGGRKLTVDLRNGTAIARFNDLSSGARTLRVALPRSATSDRAVIVRRIVLR